MTIWNSTLKRRKPLAAAQNARKAPKGTGFSAKVKLLVRTRAGNGDPEQAACEACGVHLGLHGGQVQHIYARQAGGTKVPLYQSAANAALLCGTRYTGCHYLCEDRAHPLNSHMHEAGFWRERNGNEKPGDYPVMLHGDGGGRLVWLTPEGGYADQAPKRGAA